MRQLPLGWASVNLGRLASPSRPRVAPSAHLKLPYVGMEQVESNTGRLLGTIPSGSMKSTAFRFFKDDILYGRLRPYLNKVYLAESQGLCSSEFIVFPPNEAVLPEFLAYRLRQSSFVEFANHQNQGDRPRVKFDQIAQFEILLPPKNEQRRIVDKLKEVLGKVDVPRKRLERIPSVLKRFRQSVLVAACSGRLTEDWRKNHSPKAVSIESVDAADSLEIDLPDSWRQVRLGNLLSGLKYGTARRCDYNKRGVPVLRIPNVQNGIVDCSDLKYAVLPKPELNELALEAGDLLMVRSNGSVSLVGRAAVVRDSEEGFAYAGYLLRLRSNNSVVTHKYLAFALRLPSTRAQIELPARSTSGVHNINGGEVRGLVLPLPPKEEQAEIVRQVEALLGFADKIESSYKTASAQAEQLTQSILAQAFRGELVAQDPKDESATRLLERIGEKASRSLEVARA